MVFGDVAVLFTVETEEVLLDFFKNKPFTRADIKEIEWLVMVKDTELFDSSSAEKILRSKYGVNHITFVYAEESMEISTLYNTAISQVRSKLLCFSNCRVTYDADVISRVLDAVKTYPKEIAFSTSYRCSATPGNGTTDKVIKRIDLNNTNTIHFCPYAYFLKTSEVKQIPLTATCEEELDLQCLFELFCRRESMVIVKSSYCRYDQSIRRKSNNFPGCEKKEYYLDSMHLIYLPLLKRFTSAGKDVPKWLKKILLYELYFRFYANYNLRNKYLLDAEETEEFFQIAKYILSYIDDSLIMKSGKDQQYNMPFALRNLFEYMKYDGDMTKLNRFFYIENGVLYYNQCGQCYSLDEHQDLKVMAINIVDDSLVIYIRYFDYLLYEYDNKSIFATVNDHEIYGEFRDEYSLDKAFGRSIKKRAQLRFTFSLNDILQKNCHIEWHIRLGDQMVTAPLRFFRAPSKLNNYCPSTYWMIDDNHALTYTDNRLNVIFMSSAQRKEQEKKVQKEIAHDILQGSNGKFYERFKTQANIKAIRKEYFKQRSFFEGRRIWLYFDKLFKAGDNGEYAFRYAMQQNDDIEHYYIINRDSYDYDRLIKEFPNNILVYNSMQCRLYALYSENIVATHPDIIEFCGFDARLTKYCKDLFNPNLICIAHGITIQKNADYQNRLFDNTMFYTTSSKYEVNHILHPIYGYDKNEIALTGLARFDGLINNDKKQILITPTWRRNLVGASERNTTKAYSEAFKQSSYYQIYNTLINDPRLIETAKETGYRLIYLLHPAMSTQLEDFDTNDYVELIRGSGDMSYEKILTESSLMVTDYSGIHYDFGYMKKPVIYYQPKEIPMRFEEGAMKFATMGFGPVCTEYEEVVSLLCHYMKNQCVLEEEYCRRVDDFFAFNDTNNCQRIYDAIVKWTANRPKPTH